MGSAGYITPLSEGLISQIALSPQAVTSNTNGDGIDYAGQLGEQLLFILNVGAVTGTNPTLDVTVEGTDDDLDSSPTWHTIYEYDGTTALAFTQLTDADADSQVMGSISLKRSPYKHHRLVFTIGGTSTPTFNIGAVALIGNLLAFGRAEERDDLYYKAYHEEFAG